MDTILNTLTEGEDGYLLRAFLTNTGKEILAATALSSKASYDTNAQQKAPSRPTDPRFMEVEETVLFQMQFLSGVQVTCTTSYGVHESKRNRCHTDKRGYFGLDPTFSYHGLRMEGSPVQDDMEEKLNSSAGKKINLPWK